MREGGRWWDQRGWMLWGCLRAGCGVRCPGVGVNGGIKTEKGLKCPSVFRVVG